MQLHTVTHQTVALHTTQTVGIQQPTAIAQAHVQHIIQMGHTQQQTVIPQIAVLRMIPVVDIRVHIAIHLAARATHTVIITIIKQELLRYPVLRDYESQ